MLVCFMCLTSILYILMGLILIARQDRYMTGSTRWSDGGPPPQVEEGVSVSQVNAADVHVGEVKFHEFVEVRHTQLLCHKVLSESTTKHVLGLTHFCPLLKPEWDSLLTEMCVLWITRGTQHLPGQSFPLKVYINLFCQMYKLGQNVHMCSIHFDSVIVLVAKQ